MSENRQLNSNFDFHPPEMIKPRIERDSMMFAKKVIKLFTSTQCPKLHGLHY